MSVVLAICVAVIFAVSLYMILGRELKGVAMGVFLLSHAANLSILAMSRSPVIGTGADAQLKGPPLADGLDAEAPALAQIADPLPQALILTAIVISFAVMGFTLTLVVCTGRSTGKLDLDELSEEEHPLALDEDATAEPPAPPADETTASANDSSTDDTTDGTTFQHTPAHS